MKDTEVVLLTGLYEEALRALDNAKFAFYSRAGAYRDDPCHAKAAALGSATYDLAIAAERCSEAQARLKAAKGGGK